MTGLNLRPVQWVPRIIAEIRDNGEPDLMRTHTMTTLYRKDLGAPEDFTESRNIVCMIDRVCCVMYRCNYELLISPYNLFHPTTTNTLQPGRLLRLWAAVTDCSVCVGNRENPGNLTRKTNRYNETSDRLLKTNPLFLSKFP